jgi:uncharacterized membrane protein YcaP (DUF421 family)
MRLNLIAFVVFAAVAIVVLYAVDRGVVHALVLVGIIVLLQLVIRLIAAATRRSRGF